MARDAKPAAQTSLHPLASERALLIKESRLNLLSGWAFLVGGLATGIVSTISQLISLSAGFDLRGCASALLSLLFWTLFLRYILLRRRPKHRLRGLPPADEHLEALIKSKLQRVSELTEVKPTKLRILTYNKLPSPAFTVRVRDVDYLVLSTSVAFGVTQSSEPSMAIAAHEMAHFQQQDCNYVAIASKYFEYAAAFGLPNVVLSAFGSGNHRGAQLAAGISGLTMLLLQTLANRDLRRKSEHSADLLAVIAGYQKGLLQALQRAPEPPRNSAFWLGLRDGLMHLLRKAPELNRKALPWHDLFDYHPSTKERIALLEAALTSGTTRRGTWRSRWIARRPGARLLLTLAKRAAFLLLAVPVALALLMFVAIYVGDWLSGE